MTKRFLLLITLIALAFAQWAPAAKPSAPQGEWIILVGGVSLNQWEKYKTQPHDHWWANFVHAARIRTEQLREQFGPDLMITWLVYKPAYIERAKQDGVDLIGDINSVRDKFNLNLVYFRGGSEVIDYINNGQPRNQVKIAFLEYFGHSNRACFMFDYSSNIESACKSWLHEDELKKINGRVFARGAFIKSWGCHTGESMSKKWHSATGTQMWGVIGKTQYMTDELPVAAGRDDKWVNR